MIKQEDVTTIIPHIFLSKETDYSLKECLQSLDETVPEMKKVVAINGMKFEDNFETIKYPNVEFIVLERQGQCAAVNSAVAMTNTPWVFITNNDMIYAPGWFEKLVEPLGQRYLANKNEDLMGIYGNPHGIVQVEDISSVVALPEIMCISPMLIEPRPGAPTFEVVMLGGAGGDFNKQGWLEFASAHNDAPHSPVIRTGFNLPFLIKRELWDTVGGYDINYDPWGSNSDSDLEYKIKLAGVQPYQNTNCVVYHFSQTSGTFEPRNQAAWQKNWSYFIEKWGFPRTDNGIWEANFEIPTKEQGRIFTPDYEGKYGN